MQSTHEDKNVKAALSFVRAVEAMDGSRMEGFFAPNVEQIEMPNVFKPAGQVRDLSELTADIDKSKGIIEQQKYDILNTVARGDIVVLEMVWHGTVVKDIPPLRAGQNLRAQCMAIFEFREGKVIKLRNYDCFDAL
ncbi:hypothetical protein MXMO3_03431 (plasmid) [Maritalea myrionectae]|uniref:SnoaL-like domain-containing protein n=1 Tax=Maritalea myrionectae TaxID=454601 RepID=A0A2R4MJ27_9HYPH|nr:nuclear transport factor 2 family protein [Maritalea myrionectae]AVX05934.1 hypothetical protein MXMO3_03431 [Maritalea myrionectae]